MAYDPSDAVTARALFEDAIAVTAKPILSVAQVNRGFALASSLTTLGAVVYLARDLDKAAAWAWGIKAGLASAEYEKLGGGAGVVLERKLAAECERKSLAYRDGHLTVAGNATRRSGIGSVALVSSLAADELW